MRTLHLLMAPLIACGAPAMTVSTYSYPEVCGYGNGRAGAYAYGGVEPYSFSWDNGGTTQEITGLQPGVYTVTVTDNVGEQVIQSITVGASAQLLFSNGLTTPTCPGQCTGEAYIYKPGLAGSPPYTFDPPPWTEDADYAYFGGVCAFDGSPLLITDQNGCSVYNYLSAMNAYHAQVFIQQVMPSCQGVGGHVVFTLDYALETTLRVLDNQFNEVYTDFDPPSMTPITVGGLAPGDYYIRSISDALPGEWCYTDHPFTIVDLGTDCGRVMGRLFVDDNSDCLFDAQDETPMKYRMLVVEPGPFYGITDANGNYTVTLNEGSYTIQNDDADLLPLCPPTEPVPFDITALNPVVMLDLADSSTIDNDLELTCVHSEALTGAVYHVWLTIKNLSPYSANSPNLLFTYDPLLTFLSSSYPLYTLSTGQIQWPGMFFLPGFETRVIHLQFQVPPDPGLIGTPLSSTAFVQQTPPESYEGNNSCDGTVTIIGSFDPNDKTAFTSSELSTTQYFIDEDTCITYVIRFQNTGTAPAIDVVITDTLPQTLDPATFRLLGWSDPITSVGFGPGQLVTWSFNGINLPDSGTNEAASHGFVSFRIRPREPLLPGTVITNTANIYFDLNPPVITEPSVLIAEFSTSVAALERSLLDISPNPARDEVFVGSAAIMRELSVHGPDGRLLGSIRPMARQVRLDLTGFAPGVLVLSAQMEDGRVLQRRVVKY